MGCSRKPAPSSMHEQRLVTKAWYSGNTAAKDGWRFFGRSTPVRTPNRIRTGAAAVKGRCPRPLDDGGRTAQHARDDQGYRAPIGTPAADGSGTDGAGTASGA